MAERPILFSAPMVRAILAGRKTQTRRLIRSARVFATPERPSWTLRGADLERALQNADRFQRVDGNGWRWEADAFDWQAPATRTGWLARIGYAPGDLLWVREAFAPSDAGPLYRADPIYDGMGAGDFSWSWKPSIHMPRWASRITLKVTGVKVERLQDISEEDAKAEGVESTLQRFPDGGHMGNTAAWHFSALWDQINGPGSWDANPWVAAISFERVANSDAGAGR